MAMANYDGRTPLHVAASEGGLEFWKIFKMNSFKIARMNQTEFVQNYKLRLALDWKFFCPFFVFF